MRVYQADVVKVECGAVRRVQQFLIEAKDEKDAARETGVAILKSEHNVHSAYHKFAVNLAECVPYYYDYTVLLVDRGRARPGVQVS